MVLLAVPCRHISEHGYEVISLDQYTRSSVEEYNLRSLSEKFDWVLHFGARTSIEFSRENPFQVYANNLNSTLIALNIARSTKANFVFMSSYVYGPPQYLPIDKPIHYMRSIPIWAAKLLVN